MIARFFALVVASLPMSALAQVQVFAAGSLRAPLTDIAADFEREKGQAIRLTFGASGLLRDRIVAGEEAGMLASANMEHPEALVQRRLAQCGFGSP